MNNKIIFSILSALFLGCSSSENQSLSKDYEPTTPEIWSTPPCNSKQISLVPLFHNPPNFPDPLLQGLNVPEKFIEDGTLACRSLAADKDIVITNVLVDYSQEDICTEYATLFVAFGKSGQLDGLSWKEGATLPLENLLEIPVQAGQTFYGCAKLPIKDPQHRACILSCEDGHDPNSFWANTDSSTGKVKNPIQLEPLSISPTENYAKSWGNDQRRVGIYFQWTSK